MPLVGTPFQRQLNQALRLARAAVGLSRFIAH